jgi:uncharacterized protein (TIGR02117 family)
VKKLLKLGIWGVLTLIGFIVLYLLFAALLTVIPVNNSFVQPSEGIDVFIKTNGVHTDIVVPVKTDIIDWRTKIYTFHFKPAKYEFQYIAFGWGDKGFYLYTPTWADLKYSTAFKALFWLSTSAMHVTYYNHVPSVNEQTRKITISAEQYKNFVKYISSSFLSVNNEFVPINCCHYDGVNDNFYEARGTYNLFRTCNGWSNEGLKKAGVKTALWAPFDKSVLYHLK